MWWSVYLVFLYLQGLSCNEDFGLYANIANLTSTNESPADPYTQNVIAFVSDFKSEFRRKLTTMVGGDLQSFSKKPSSPIYSTKPQCLDVISSILKLPDTSPQFEWLIQMLDSTGSIPSGFLSGTVSSLGDFDQCLRIPEQYGSVPVFDTQYCLLTLRTRRNQKNTYFQFTESQNQSLSDWDRAQIHKWLVTDNRVPIVIGLCLPKICKPEDINRVVAKSNHLLNYLDADVQYCQSKSKDGDLSNIIPLLLVLFLLSGMIGVGTGLDYLSNKDFGKDRPQYFTMWSVRVVRCFSLISNVRALFNLDNCKSDSPTESNKEKQTESIVGNKKAFVHLDILDGIRVLSIIWIIVLHCSAFTQVPFMMKVSPFAHFPESLIRSKNENWLLSTYLLSPFYPVSIFFMISGIVLSYNRKSNQNSCNGLSHFFYYASSRILRLSPTFWFALGVTYYLRYLGNGPLFHQDLVSPFVEPCREKFWYHLFYIHNYLPTNQRCGSHTWYMSADLQLHLVAFFFVHLVQCYSKKFYAFALSLMIMAVCGIIPLALIWLGFGRFPDFNVYVDTTLNIPSLDFTLFYYATYMHAGSFFIGILLGFILAEGWKLEYITKNKIFQFSILHVAMGVMMLVPIGMRYFVFDVPQHEQWHPLLTAIIFQSLSYLFNISLALCILVCAHNPKMLLSQFLSAKIFRPMARLVFGAYLTHQILIWFTIQQFRFPFTVNVQSTFTFIVTIMALTSISSIVLYLLVERPFMQVSKILLRNQKSHNRCPMRSFNVPDQNENIFLSSKRIRQPETELEMLSSNSFQNIKPSKDVEPSTTPVVKSFPMDCTKTTKFKDDQLSISDIETGTINHASVGKCQPDM